MRLSELKNSILSRRVSVGTWISIGHPDVTEMLAHQGFDWLLFDLEHGPLS
ncbi:MAG: aldolase/citrate lyase family protein [Spirochaetaceae bacterium]|nr:aldolase/citrate lyase family protein [Spirochaetaceae bacterium]